MWNEVAIPVDPYAGESALRDLRRQLLQHVLRWRATLVPMYVMESEHTAGVYAEALGLPSFSLESMLGLRTRPDRIDEDLCRQFRMCPIYERGQTLFVAVSESTDLDGLTVLKERVGRRVCAVVVEEEAISWALGIEPHHPLTTEGQVRQVEFRLLEIFEDYTEAGIRVSPFVRLAKNRLLHEQLAEMLEERPPSALVLALPDGARDGWRLTGATEKWLLDEAQCPVLLVWRLRPFLSSLGFAACVGTAREKDEVMEIVGADGTEVDVVLRRA